MQKHAVPSMSIGGQATLLAGCLLLSPVEARGQEAPSSQSPPSVAKRSLFTVDFGFGGGFGGEDLLRVKRADGSTERVGAGTAGMAFVGTSVIPYRSGRHAFGLSTGVATHSWAENSGGDADTLWFSRYAAFFFPRYSYEIGASLDWLIGLGMQREVLGEATGRGAFASVHIPVESTTAYFIDSGIRLRFFAALSSDLTLRYTNRHYRGGSIDGLRDGSFIGIVLTASLVSITVPPRAKP